MRETSDAYWARIYGQPSFDPVTHPLWLKNAGIAFMLAYPLILGLTSADSGDEASVDRDEYGDDADDSAWNMMARCYACKDESNRHGRDVFLRRGRMSAERRRCDHRKRGTVMGVIGRIDVRCVEVQPARAVAAHGSTGRTDGLDHESKRRRSDNDQPITPWRGPVMGQTDGSDALGLLPSSNVGNAENVGRLQKLSRLLGCRREGCGWCRKRDD